MKDVVRYSESFKKQVVRELENGDHVSCFAASNAYGIKGVETVSRWVSAYGKTHLLRRVIRVETTEERSELKRLKERVRELEGALSNTHIELRLEQAYLKIACRDGGIDDVESFKKKAAGMPSMMCRKTRMEAK